MDAGLEAKLESISERCEELSAMLCDPEITGDKSKFLQLSREHADLSRVAEAFERYNAARAQIADAEEMLNDPDMRDLAQDDIQTQKSLIESLELELQKLLLPKDPNDSKNVILEIRAGAGGDEAALFAADLWRMYTRHAERRGWSVQALGSSDSPGGGVKEINGLIKGKDVYAALKFERGVHRVQRVPATESQGRIHTSTATVAIMPEAEEVDIDIVRSDLRIETMRSGGAGGQHVNTTDSGVRITHEPTGLAVHCTQEKSQTKNREIAMRLLRSRLLGAEIQRYEEARAADRKEQVGSGDRSEKIRTYNFPQDRLSDHRIGLTRHNLSAFLDGDTYDVMDALRADDEASRLADLKRGDGH